MRSAIPASNLGRLYDSDKRHWPALAILRVVLTEFRRAAAAAQSYEDLRYRNACGGGVEPSGIPRQIFAIFYST